MRIPECVVIALVALWVAGCASTSAPDGFLPHLDEMDRHVYGGWAECTLTGGVAAGELLAVDSDSLVLLSGGRMRAVPMHRIVSMHVTGYSVNYGMMALWTVLGTASTLSHGIILVISAPIWVIVGTIATVSTSFNSREDVSRRDLENPASAIRAIERLRMYARFPQGIPPSLDPATLESKAANPRWPAR